jgi:uncharacterized protein
MANLRLFEIDIYNLPNKEYEYQFDINDKFFAQFEDSIVTKGNLVAKVKLLKHPGTLELHFDIQGTVVLTCDRSLDEYDETLHSTERLLLKYGEENAEISDEIISITRDTHRFNVAQYLYEFIGIAIPIVKRHPRYKTEEDNDDEEDGVRLIYQSSTPEEEDESEGKEENEDPRWALLKNLKNNLN